MNIFKKKSHSNLSQQGAIPEITPTYNQVLEYMVGLNKSEYNKLIQVAEIYRQAEKDAAKILGTKKPVTASLEDEETEEFLDQLLDEELKKKK